MSRAAGWPKLKCDHAPDRGRAIPNPIQCTSLFFLCCCSSAPSLTSANAILFCVADRPIGRRRNWPHANEKRLPKMKRRKKQETIEAPQTVAIKRIHVFSARVNQKATSISMCFFFHFKFVSSRVAQLAVLAIVAPADHFCRCRKVMTNRRCGAVRNSEIDDTIHMPNISPFALQYDQLAAVDNRWIDDVHTSPTIFLSSSSRFFLLLLLFLFIIFLLFLLFFNLVAIGLISFQ